MPTYEEIKNARDLLLTSREEYLSRLENEERIEKEKRDYAKKWIASFLRGDI